MAHPLTNEPPRHVRLIYYNLIDKKLFQKPQEQLFLFPHIFMHARRGVPTVRPRIPRPHAGGFAPL